MSDLQEIKTRIFEEELITDILKELGCENIKAEQHGDLFTAKLPDRYDSKNIRAVQVKNTESLTSHIRNKGISGDIFAVIGFILYECEDFEQVKEKLFQIKAWVCNLFEWDEYIKGSPDFEEVVPKKDWNAWLRPFQKNRKNKARTEQLGFKNNNTLDERVLNKYIDLPHKEFLKDGISCKTQRDFGVMYDMDSIRIIYPFRNVDGELIGVKGRYVGKDQEVLSRIKYLFLYPCDKSIELYNLDRAITYIKQAGEVIVFESAKSVMLAWQWGYKNVVSIEGSELTPVQASLLKSLEVDVVFALDKDMSNSHLDKQAKQIKNRLLYKIYDNTDLLKEKESPVDVGPELWEKLYTKHKYRINT